MITLPFTQPKDKDAALVSENHRPIIELRGGVQKSYKSAAGDFPALKGINLRIHPGEFVSIISKSDSGKSTLLNMTTGIDRPTSGEVLVNGTAIHELNENQLAIWRARQSGHHLSILSVVARSHAHAKCNSADGPGGKIQVPPAA